jgi:hypothetical protein
MSKRRKTLLLLAAVVLAVGAYTMFVCENEPSHNGRKLSEWVGRLEITDGRGNAVDPEAGEAIRQLGARAVPYLFDWIRYDGPAWRYRLSSWGKYWPFKWLAARVDKKSRRALNAARAFEFAEPSTAVPVLSRVLHQPKPGENQFLAVYALGRLGPRAHAPLVAGLTNPCADLRWYCIEALAHSGSNAGPVLPALMGRLGDPAERVREAAASTLGWLNLQPALVVPALTNALDDPEYLVRARIAEALGRFGKKAVSAVPSLRRAVMDQYIDVREAATNALREIAPEALTTPPPGKR